MGSPAGSARNRPRDWRSVVWHRRKSWKKVISPQFSVVSKPRPRAGLKPGLYKCFLRELAEEADVVLEKDLDIVDAVLEHGEAIDADAEGEAADLLGVVVYEAVDGGIDHAGAEEFDPGRAFTF